jgi:hypothetical protein
MDCCLLTCMFVYLFSRLGIITYLVKDYMYLLQVVELIAYKWITSISFSGYLL